MLHRRSTIPALLLALPLAGALTSCGFDYPTDRNTQYGPGANDRAGTVDVLGARIVADRDGNGRLIGSFANNNPDEASLVSVSSDEVDLTAEVDGVEIAAGRRVNLTDDVEVPVTGRFTAGEVVELVYEFSTGETVEVNVPIVKNCFQYADVEVPQPSGSAEPSDEPSASPEAEDAAGTGEGPDWDREYVCDHETPGAGEGGH